MDIQLANISKQYRYKKVLNDVSLHFKSGKIHALLGENGAGKTTLASILSGAINQDSGKIFLDGKAVFFASEKDALSKGIVCIQQRPLVADGISVKENILLGTAHNDFEKNMQKKLKRSVVFERARMLQKKWAPLLSLNSKVLHIGGDGRFYTALIAALVKEPRVIILDEPSALLDWEQRRSLYANIRELAADGTTVIVITHIMQEAMFYTDTITVLQNGSVAKIYEPSSSFRQTSFFSNKNFHADSSNELNSFKNANSVKTCLTSNTSSSAIESIEFSNIFARPKKRPALYDISFSVLAGSITLIQGLQESGLGTLENIVCGMEKNKITGTVKFNFNEQHPQQSDRGIVSSHKVSRSGPFSYFDANIGMYTPSMNHQKKNICITLDVKKMNPKFLRKKINTAIIPSDRNFRGANPNLSILQLVAATNSCNKSDAFANKIIKNAGVHINIEEKVSALSGGMLQRLIFAREFYEDVHYVIACEPLQGLDTEAVSRTLSLLQECANRGAAVLILSSSEFPKAICKQVYNLRGGILCRHTT